MPSNEYSMLSSASAYDIQDIYHSQITKPLNIICIGAGISGLCLAYKLKKRAEQVNITIYEKNEDVGGTWLENRYPGCACDVPAHLYTFSWDPKPDWTQFYASSAEIHGYVKGFCEKHALSQHIQLAHKVKKATWNEASGEWLVEVQDLKSGVSSTETCHVLVNATGFLNKWKWPDIPGLHTFKGVKLHSAAWDPEVDCKGKSVGVIGTGSSAIQIVPQMQKVVRTLDVFMRSPTWISPAFGGGTAALFRHGNEDNNRVAADGKPHEQITFSESDIEKFRADPAFHLQTRREMEAEMNFLIDMFITGTDMQVEGQKNMAKIMEARIGEGHDELKARLIPTWTPGCRRITPGDGYLESLVKGNVRAVFGDIERIDAEGVVTEDGKRYNLDILICATGFDVSFVPSFELVGRNGVRVAEAWKHQPDGYLGLTAPGFPNYFILCGPQGPLGIGSILPAIEVMCDYICTMALKMQQEQIKALEPKRDATDEFHQHMSLYHKRTVWSSPCRSWYKNGKPDGEPQLWCGSALSYIKTILQPRFEDYNITYHTSNRWAFVGNGKVKAHYALRDGKADTDLLSPYIRNADTPWELE